MSGGVREVSSEYQSDSILDTCPCGYKKTEVGVIPEDWRVVTIGKLSSDVGDGIHSTPIYSSTGMYYFVNGNNIANGTIKVTEDTKQVDESEYHKHKKNLSKRTILISINGTIGNLAFYNNEPVVLGKSAAYLNIKEKHSKQFIYYGLQTKSTNDFFSDGLTGSTIKNLGLGVIRATPIALPANKEEQTAIANALTDVDALITSLETLITKKRAIKTAAMQQLLTGKKRLPPFDKTHTGYKQTELGEIPEDWEWRLLPELVISGGNAIKIGPFGSALKKEYLTKDGCKVYGQENVYDKDMEVGDRFISQEHYYQLRSCSIKTGDFLISMMGTVGKCFIVPKGSREGIMDSHLLRLRIDGTKLDKRLLIHFFQSSLVLRQIKQLSVGGIMEGLSSKIIKCISVPVGCIDEQKMIAEALDSIDIEINALEQRLTKTQQLKQGMMQELLTGKTRLI